MSAQMQCTGADGSVPKILDARTRSNAAKTTTNRIDISPPKLESYERLGYTTTTNPTLRPGRGTNSFRRPASNPNLEVLSTRPSALHQSCPYFLYRSSKV
jgi:hypothetical protein